MPLEISFKKVWTVTEGEPDTPSVDEIGTCFDAALLLMVAGTGPAAVTAATTASTTTAASDDGLTPLHLVRVLVPPSLGPIVFAGICSAVTACATIFVNTAVPPTPTQATAAFVSATPTIPTRSATLDAAIGTYLSTAWVGGV